MADDVLIFDQAAVTLHRRRARGLDRRKRFLRDEVRSRLLERLGDVRRRFGRVLDLGSLDCREDRAALLPALAPSADLVSFDPAACEALACGAVAVAGSAELLPFAAGSFDLVFSVLGLQWVSDLPGALLQLRASLRADGLLLAALFGGRTLAELREVLTLAELDVTGGVSPRVSPFADLRSAAGLLQRAGFALPVADLETITLTYPNALALMAELRALGETNALLQRRRGFTRRAVLLRAAELYAERFAAPGGRISARFDILMLTGWAPAASQPKPLKRGSATRSLADELGS